MTRTNTQIATEAYAAFARGDIDAFFKDFDDKSSLIEADSLPYGGVHTGLDNARAALFSIAAAWDNIDFQIDEILAGDKYVIAYGRFIATARNTRKRIDMPLAEVWTFDNQRVKSITPLYFDTSAAKEALNQE